MPPKQVTEEDLKEIFGFIAAKKKLAPNRFEKVHLGYVMHQSGLEAAQNIMRSSNIRPLSIAGLQLMQENLLHNFNMLKPHPDEVDRRRPRESDVDDGDEERESDVDDGHADDDDNEEDQAVQRARLVSQGVGSQCARLKLRSKGTCMTQQFKREQMEPPENRHSRRKKQ